VKLQIGSGQTGARLDEAARFDRRVSERAALVDREARDPRQKMAEAHHRRRRFRKLVGHRREQVILQVLSDARQIEHHRQAQLFQVRGGSDPRKHQELRRSDRPGAEHDFFLRQSRVLGLTDLVAHARDARAARHDLGHVRIGHDLEVLSIASGAKKCDGSAATIVVAARHLINAGALGVSAVEIVDERDSGAGCQRGGERQGRRAHVAHFLHVEAAFCSVMVARAAHVSLRALEIRQYVVPAPAGISEIAPAVVVVAMSAHVEHRVQRARSTEDLASWPEHAPVVDVALRFGGESPVVFAAPEREVEAGRADPE
jgi:hypothetical protein